MTDKATVWSPRRIYLYLVCLITLVMVIFSTVNLVRAVVEFVYPEPAPIIEPVRAPNGEIEAPDTAAQREAYQQAWATRRAILSLVGNGALLAIAGPLYLYHWRKIEREPNI